MHPGALVADRWEILEPLGAGGMGDVYRVRHRVTRAEAALKIIRAHGAYSPEAATRFQREASAPAQIGHPRIAAALDAGVDPATGQLYLVTELLHGHTLRAEMGPQALPRILDLLEPLAAAHSAGFVHRDLKPENVFVDRTRGVVLLDFGLVRGVGDQGATADGAMMGTPDYMAPEQSMSARDATAAADVWAVGVMLYEAIAGRRPFTGGSIHAVVIAVQTDHHTPLSLVVPSVPPALSTLVDRCLAKHPSQRPANAVELLRALRAIGVGRLGGLAATPTGPDPHVATPPIGPNVDPVGATMPSRPALTPAVPPTAAPRPSAPPKRRGPWLIAALAVALAGMLLGGGGVIAWLALFSTEMERGPGWSLELPRGWVRRSSPTPGFDAIFEEPLEEGEIGALPTVSVAHQPCPMTLDACVHDSVQLAVDSGAFIEGNVTTTMSGLPAREVVITYRGYEYGGYTQAQRMVKVGSTAWVATCSGSVARWDDVRPVCREILDSVVLDR